MPSVRYVLVLLVVALIGTTTFVSAASDGQQTAMTPSDSSQLARFHSHGEAKRFLRQEGKTTTNRDEDGTAVPASDEERAIIGSALKNWFYNLMAAANIRPQTLLVRLGIVNGNAHPLLHRFYDSYSRWYGTYHAYHYMY